MEESRTSDIPHSQNTLGEIPSFLHEIFMRSGAGKIDRLAEP
jgi:hypothetical protein